MTLTRIAATGTALLMGVALLTAAPSTATAVADPVVEESGDTVTYTDPDLAREKTTTVEGTLRIAYVDRVDRAGRPSSELEYSVETEDGESVPVDLAEELPTSAANGAIEAEVVDAGSEDAQLSEATVETAPATAAPAVGSPHRAYVALVSKTGAMPSEATIASRLEDTVLAEWVDESDGAIPAFTVEETATLPANAPASQNQATLCSMFLPYGLWDEGAAAFPGVDFDTPGTPNHLIMITSGSGCSSISTTGLGIGTLGQGINDGGYSTVLWDERYLEATAVHELGHNFSLGHANAKPCSTCSVDPYYDIFSVMGFGTENNQPPALDSGYRDLLGITQPGEVDTVEKDSSAQSTVAKTLQPRGATTGLRSLRVVDPVGGQEYWVENRAGGDADRDAGATYVNRVLTVKKSVNGALVDTNAYRFRTGVTVTQMGEENALELLPVESGFTDEGAVQEGQTWISPSGGVQIVVDSAPAGAPAEVTVTTRTEPPNILTSGYGHLAMVGRAAFNRPSGWPANTTFSHVWKANGQTVSRAATYTPHPSRRGHTLQLELTGTPPGGSPTTSTSLPTTINYGRFSAPRPRVSGTLKVGRTLKASRGTWKPSATKYYYRWYRSTKVISGATKSSYKLTKADKGHRIRVRVVGRRDGYAQLITYSYYRGPTK